MELGRWRIQILDPKLFIRKVVLLLVFTGGLVPLKYYKIDVALFWYVVVLLILHVYFLFILIWRVQWKQLAQHRRSFALRLVAVAFFIFLLSVLQTGVTFTEFMIFLGASLIVHTFLLLSLTLTATRLPTPGEPVPSPAE
jgi:hypothetical protein